jgi:hypothetical protein
VGQLRELLNRFLIDPHQKEDKWSGHQQEMVVPMLIEGLMVSH